MKQHSFFSFLTGLVATLLLTACGRAPEAPPLAVKEWKLPVVTVTAGAPLEYTSVGSVVSDQRVEVASRLSGYVREMRVQEGDAVRAGQVLARIEAVDVDSGIAQAQAQATSADAAYRDAKIDLERYQTLYEKGNVSDSEMRKVRLRNDALLETLNQAHAALASARAQRDYAEIRSPIDGIVVARLRHAGDLAVPGGPLLTLESGRDLVFETFVTEQQIARIAPGKPATIRIDGLDTPLKGTVRRVIQSADPVTRSYPVRVALPGAHGLMPGMFGRVEFVLGTSPVPVIPLHALAERGGLRGVFVVGSKGLATFRWLRLGREWPDRVEVTAGLDAGERIVAQTEPALREGDRIVALTDRAP